MKLSQLELTDAIFERMSLPRGWGSILLVHGGEDDYPDAWIELTEKDGTKWKMVITREFPEKGAFKSVNK